METSNIDIKMSLMEHLYVNCGYSVEEISSLTGSPKTYIEMVIEEQGWSRTELPVASVEDITDGVKLSEARKQAALTPLYDALEVSLIQKIFEQIEMTNNTDSLQKLVGMFKDLRGNSIAASVGKVKEEASTGGISVINVIQSFRKSEDGVVIDGTTRTE